MTASPATLLALASEVEAGEGPDRELDARIAMAVGADLAIGDWIAPDTYEAVAGTYTASVDAAIALLREALPGWETDIEEMTEHHCKVSLRGFADGEYAEATGKRLASVLVAAVLRAVAGRG